MVRTQIVISALVAVMSLSACGEVVSQDPDASTNPPSDDGSSSTPPDDSGSAVCDPSIIVNQVWEFSSNNTFFYLQLDPSGTYRRETDGSSATCEHGDWIVSDCGVIEFHTCRGTTERRNWTATPTTFVLDQTTYRPSQLNADTAFIFCDANAC